MQSRHTIVNVQVGDIITMINGTSTDHIRHDEAIQLFKAESSVAVQVTQGDDVFFAGITST